MKKISAVLLAVIGLASCKGEDNVNIYKGQGSWKLGNTTYQVYKAYKADNGNKFIAETNFASGENITFQFQALPTEDGIYHVKKFDFFTGPASASDVTVIASGAGKNYGSMGTDSIRAEIAVKIVKGKINLQLPSSLVRNLSGPDSSGLSASIIED